MLALPGDVFAVVFLLMRRAEVSLLVLRSFERVVGLALLEVRMGKEKSEALSVESKKNCVSDYLTAKRLLESNGLEAASRQWIACRNGIGIGKGKKENMRGTAKRLRPSEL